MIELIEPHSPRDWQTARQLIEAYVRSLQVDLTFQDLAHELDHLESEYGRPNGTFLIARERDTHLGCVGLRRFSDDAGEMKRLYVLPEARSRGVGRLLANAIVTSAIALGYTRLLLDTLSTMKEGQALYLSLGFESIPAYRFNPIDGVEFLAKKLS